MTEETPNEPGEELIPATPSAEDYEREAAAQDAFSAEADQGDVFGEIADPMALFAEWLKLAGEHEVNDPNAMTVSSIDADGFPDSRVVLLKELDEGLSFYTNMESAKGQQLVKRPQCSILFHWKSLRRQVRFQGLATPVSDQKADAYFAKRDRGSRIGAWASQQSRAMTEPDILKTRIADYESLFEGRDVPRPDFWRGFHIAPQRVEFWVNRPFRLHERRVFTKQDLGWTVEHLYP